MARHHDPRRTCARCGRPLLITQRDDAAFDKIACKKAWQKARDGCWQPGLAEVAQTLGDVDAIWYRLAIFIEDAGALVYPPQNKPFLRFDRLRRSTLGFRVRPYEPPNVPVSGEYRVILLDEDGQKLPQPPGIYSVHAEPIRRRVPVPIKAGDPWRE